MSSPASSHSPFQRLSGELRNLIYRHVLVEPHPIPTRQETWFAEPALLRVSRAIRLEAEGIYYFENRFVYEIVDFDTGVALAWASKASAVLSRLGGVPRVGAAIYRSRDWGNLRRWLREYHAGRLAPRIEMTVVQGHVGPEERILCGLFDLADGFREVEWKRIDKALEVQHEVLVLLDPRWRVVEKE